MKVASLARYGRAGTDSLYHWLLLMRAWYSARVRTADIGPLPLFTYHNIVFALLLSILSRLSIPSKDSQQTEQTNLGRLSHAQSYRMHKVQEAPQIKALAFLCHQAKLDCRPIMSSLGGGMMSVVTQEGGADRW